MGNNVNGRRMFAPAERAKLLAQTILKPTGVVFEWSGVEFDLMPVSFGVVLELTGTLDQAKSLWDRVQRAADKDGEAPSDTGSLVTSFLGLIAQEAPQFIKLVREHLAKSPGVVPDDHPGDRKLFEEWFAAQDATGMLRALLPLVRETLGRRPLQAAEALANLDSAETIPTPST
jgi:hypothetical protein